MEERRQGHLDEMDGGGGGGRAINEGIIFSRYGRALFAIYVK
jgi:hypothetical protein